VDYRQAELCIAVDDDGVGAPAGTTGNGTRGMIERAAAVGGRVVLGPRPDGGFRVTAVLPLPEEG
jgi:signal transduction histidine kinase